MECNECSNTSKSNYGSIIITIIINIIIIIVRMRIKQRVKYFWYYYQLDYFFLRLSFFDCIKKMI